MYLVRKVTRAKWERTEQLDDDEIPADAVTADLRTTNNALSLWSCADPTGEQLNDAILALVAGSERVDKIDVVWIKRQAFVDAVEVQESQGRTPVADLVDRHRDAVRLDYGRLGLFAKQIVAALKDDRVKRLTKKKVAQLIASAVKANRLNLDALEDRVKAEVQKHLGSD